MRRLVVLFIAVMTLMALPLTPATAQAERFEAVVVAQEVPVGTSADGATVTAGTWAILFDGQVVGGGTVEGRYYAPGDGVHGTRHFVDAFDGSITETEVKGYIVGVDPTGTIISYVYQETIVFDSLGFGGQGRGTAQLTLIDGGASFVLDTTTHVILNL